MHSPTCRPRCAALLALLALFTARAAAAEPLIWLVAPGDDAEAWQACAAQTWTPGAIQVEDAATVWPPQDDGRAHAYFDGDLPAGTVVVRAPGAPERRIPVMMEGVTQDEARAAVLLLVGSIVHPLGIADGGWVPESDTLDGTLDETTRPPEIAPDLPPPAAPQRRTDRIHVAMALGASGRPGLDRPCFAPSARLGIALGPRREVRVSAILDLSADLFGLTWAGDVPLQLDAIGLVGGIEVRLGNARIGFPVWAGAGIRALTASRGDHEEGGYPAAVAPFLRFGGGLSVEVTPGVRLGARAIVGFELLRGDPPIQLQVGEAWDAASRDLTPVSIGGQFEVEIDAQRGLSAR